MSFWSIVVSQGYLVFGRHFNETGCHAGYHQSCRGAVRDRRTASRVA
ncbi:hypothetical protein ACFPRL_19125 [Pseudoclavibacter helvolus]